jgi:hypothetical protein
MMMMMMMMMMILKQSAEWELAGETEVLGENLPPVPLCPPQIPHDVTQAKTRNAAMGSRQLTGWAIENATNSEALPTEPT